LYAIPANLFSGEGDDEVYEQEAPEGEEAEE
jgi:hypothetical protein